jgi:hypothetical protein
MDVARPGRQRARPEPGAFPQAVAEKSCQQVRLGDYVELVSAFSKASAALER